MECKITARNIELSDDLKKYIAKRMAKLNRLYGRVFGCEVILEEEKIRKTVEIIIKLKRNRLVAKESSTDIFSSIDIATEKVYKQLRRLRDKVKTKQRRAVINTIMRPMKWGQVEENEEQSD